MALTQQLKSSEPCDDDADRAHHRRLGFLRRRRHPGRPEDLCRARRLRRLRHHGADRAEHAAASAASIRCRPISSPRRSMPCSPISPSSAVKIGMVAQLATIDAIAAGLDALVAEACRARSRDGRDLGRSAAGGGRRRGAANKTHSARLADHARTCPRPPRLLDEPVAASEAAIESQGKRLLAMGCRAVLIKGGHGQGAESIDYLVTAAARRAGRAAHRHQEYPRHRMLAVIGHRGRPRQRRGAWKPPCATPRPGSAPRSRRPIASASATATDRSIIFTVLLTVRSAKRTWSIARLGVGA